VLQTSAIKQLKNSGSDFGLPLFYSIMHVEKILTLKMNMAESDMYNKKINFNQTV